MGEKELKYLGDNVGELWDVYDQDRRLTGKLHKRGIPMNAGEYRMVVHVCIFNEKGQFLIQKRNQWKSKYPGFWDISVGGSAQHGDNSRSAAERETLEEVGLNIDLTNIRPLFSINFKEGFDDYYFITVPGLQLDSLTPQPEEVDELAWVTREQVKELIERKEFVPYVFGDKIFDFYENTYHRTFRK